MDVVCISASNIAGSVKQSVSYKICNMISEMVKSKGLTCEITDLRDYNISPCIGCGKCFSTKRCINDEDFNDIYDKLLNARCAFFISPHYAPIPAKLCMLLEKMEEITFLHWWKDSTYKSEIYGLPAGIISHGGGCDWALKSYRRMVNDTIANALDTIQCKVIPYSMEWNTGISLPVSKVIEEDGIFPVQEYDWRQLEDRISEYVGLTLKKAEIG